MKRLVEGANEVWEVRIGDEPKARIFGAFIGYDCLVCTNMRMRDDLGRYGSSEWHSAKNKVQGIWANLFPGKARFTGTHFSHYVSKGVH
jgi:hypothetical protein